MTLEAEGFEVETYNDGQSAALDAFNKQAARHGRSGYKDASDGWHGPAATVATKNPNDASDLSNVQGR